MRKIKKFSLTENAFMLRANQMKELVGGFTTKSSDSYYMYCACKDADGAWTGYYKYEMSTGFFYSSSKCGGTHAYSCAIIQ